MLFTVKNRRFVSTERLKYNTLLSAYFVIKNYPMRATEQLMDSYIQQQYNESLKNMCIKLLLSITYYEDDAGDLVLLFKDKISDTIASLITYGNGAIPGSKILQTALSY